MKNCAADNKTKFGGIENYENTNTQIDSMAFDLSFYGWDSSASPQNDRKEVENDRKESENDSMHVPECVRIRNNMTNSLETLRFKGVSACDSIPRTVCHRLRGDGIRYPFSESQDSLHKQTHDYGLRYSSAQVFRILRVVSHLRKRC